MARRAPEGRHLYLVQIYREGSRKDEVHHHLDVYKDEQKMHDILVGAVRRAKQDLDDLPSWSMRVTLYDDRDVHLDYGTTANG